MKKIVTKMLFFGLAVVFSTSSIAQITWDFGVTGNLSAYPSSGIPANIAVDSLTKGNSFGNAVLLSTTSVSSTYPGFTAGGNAGVPCRTGALDYTINATTGSAFFEVTFTPDAGYSIDITAISFGSRSTGTGPKKYSIRTSLDSYMTEVAGDTINSASGAWGLRTNTMAVTGTPGTPITLRIYAYEGTGSATAGTVNFRIDDLKITATASLALPQVVFQPADALVCSGSTAQFEIYSPGANTYQWEVDMGSGFVALANTGVYSGADDDTLYISDVTGMDGYIYHCIVTNGAGDTNSDDATLNVSAPVIPVVTIPTSMPALCEGDAISITANATNEGLAPMYEWFLIGFGSVGTGSALNVPAGFLPAGTHSVYCELTSNAACANPTLVSSDTLTVTVAPLPAVPVITVVGNTLSTSLYDTYQWYLNDTIALGTDSSQLATISGDYSVVVTNADGCENSSTNYPMVVTSINSMYLKPSLTIAPNPSVTGMFNVFNASENTLITVYNIVGKLVYSKQLTVSGNQSIDLSNQANGSYFVTIKTEKETITQKLIVNK
ncbi:MAG: T9SS type A sorting domain-containing protein [Bacteroidia bacterium]|nr:T9SS type A sorting domain-containing protein [Bacteroidia bacterium]